MPRNGTGTYSLPAGNPVVAGSVISETWANTTLTDIATGITNSLAADGQTVVVGNIPLNGYKITGLGDATLAQDAVTKTQLDEKAALTGATFSGLVTATAFTMSPISARFTAKFSETTVSTRAMFVTSTTNGSTNVGAVPNGTNTTASFQALADSDATDCARGVFGISGADSEVVVESGITGTATYFPLVFKTNGAAQWGIEIDGRVYGKNLHNVGTVTGTTKQYLASGTYTPTITGVTNVTGFFSAKAQWMRVGNVVTVTGGFALTPTATAAETTVRISLPLASNLAAVEDLNGSGSLYIAGANALGMVIQADATNNEAFGTFRSPTTAGSLAVTFALQYEVL